MIETHNALYVVKIGTRVIVQDNDELDYNRLSKLADLIAELRAKGHGVVIVSSGAVPAGRSFARHFKGVPRGQKHKIYFSIGQPRLMRFYSDMFMKHGALVSEVLLTRDCFANRQEYFAIRDTLQKLLANGVIPIVNDNDLLHKTESSFSDNDHLAAYIGGMLNADKVLFLTSTDGLYERFEDGVGSNLISEIRDDFSVAFSAVADEAPRIGGMRSKLAATKLLYDVGVSSLICNGCSDTPLEAFISHSAPGTHIVAPSARNLSGVRKWLSTGAVPVGTLVVSEIGVENMQRHEQRSSLLARGVVDIEGDFKKGDVVSLVDEDRKLIGFGITRIASGDIGLVRGEEGIIVVHADYFYGTDFSYFE